LAQATGLACGALTAATLIGFLTPLPVGAAPFGKYAQSAFLLVLVLGICLLARKTSQTPTPST
jgi:hypothetical protein